MIWQDYILIVLFLVILAEAYYLYILKFKRPINQSIKSVSNDVRRTLRAQYVGHQKLIKEERRLYKNIDYLLSELPRALALAKTETEQ